MTGLSRPLLATLIGILLTADAGAQAPPEPAPTYRSVGPNGRIIYSDRMPTDPQLRTQQIGKTVYAPLLAPSSAPFDLHPAASVPPAPRSPSDGLSPAVDISGKPFAPGLPEAILDVVVHQFFVQSLVEMCSRVRPAYTDHYQGSVRNWRDRNGDILSRSNRIAFSRFTGEQRDTLRSTARARLDPLLPPPGASDAEKSDWCDRMNTDLARHQFELVGDMRVAPILHFEAP
jgi:hypothetical protein